MRKKYLTAALISNQALNLFHLAALGILVNILDILFFSIIFKL